jgi:hypothetical protein
MSYGNYIQGSVDSTNNAYNVLLSGAPSGYTSSGLNIGGDTSTMYGVKLSKDATNNAYLDLRADASNKMSIRYKDNTTGAISSMLDLVNDSALSDTTKYGATINGRVKASSYYVGSSDTRAPVNTGVYMGFDASNVGYFKINKGSGSGGFSFRTYNTDGTLLQSNLNLLASGVIQASYYTATGNVADSEAVALMGFDASGNFVRNYAANARFRALEARATAIENDLTGAVPTKVNEIVTRLNGLNFFSQNIATIAVFTPNILAAPIAPTSVVGTIDSSTSVSVEFTGDNKATSYAVTSSPSGITATGTSSPILITGLTSGVSYTFTVTASNSVGTSQASVPSAAVTPTNVIGPKSCTLQTGSISSSGGTYTIWNSGGNIQFLLGMSVPWWNNGVQVDMLNANSGLTFNVPAGTNIGSINMGFQNPGEPGYTRGYFIAGGNYWATDSYGLSNTIKLYKGSCHA